MSPKAIALQDYFHRLSTLYEPITLKNPRNKDLSGFRILATKINKLFSSYASKGDTSAVVFSDRTTLLGTFRLREVRDPGLSLAQGKVLDLINQEAFDFFQEFAVDGVQYANAFGEAMCANALGYKIWTENSYQPIAPHTLHWEPLQMLDDLLAAVDETYWISSTLGRKFPTGKINTPVTSNPRFIRFLNGDELTDAGAFGTLQKISAYHQESFSLSLVPNTKTIDIKGDEVMRSLGRTVFKNLALADPHWLSKHGYLRSVTTKGVVPDGLFLFGFLHNTFPTIDTAVLFEHLDYIVNARGWYARQKQFDTKTLLEHGIPLISIVNTYAMYNSYLEFPTDLVITKNNLPLRIPTVIGFNNPLLTKLQALLLGLVFKTPDLILTTEKFDSRPLVELSFKEILCHLDQIVAQNQAILPSFTQAEVHLIQEQFGIRDGIIHDALPIQRDTYLQDPYGNLIFHTHAKRTYTVRMAAFWQAIDSTGSVTLNSLIIGLTYGLCDAQGASLISRPNILTHILQREYGGTSLYP